METVQYGQGPLPFEIPADASITEITPYLWPGHYGEWDEAAQEFTAWALVSPSLWRVTSEIQGPPLPCLSVGATVKRLRFRCGLSSDPPNASQEFHVEFRRSVKLSDLSPTDQWGMAPPVSLQQKTHPGPLQKTHLESPLKTHPGPPLKTHPEPPLKTHPEPPLKTHPEPPLKTHPALEPVATAQEAVWRIHIRNHAKIHTS